MGLQSLWKNRFLSATKSQTPAFRYKGYGRPTLATAFRQYATWSVCKPFETEVDEAERNRSNENAENDPNDHRYYETCQQQKK